MKVVRTVTQGEADEFLKLLCRCFSLDPTRASSVFYQEPFYDLDRKWALFHDGVMQSILTTTPLIFGWGRAAGIAGVATNPDLRGQGLGEHLLNEVARQSEMRGERALALFAHRTELYKRVGFSVADTVVRGLIRSESHVDAHDMLPDETIQTIYDRWAEASPGRLRRDGQRWDYWHWSLRSCQPWGHGYLCLEPQFIREAILDEPQNCWPVVPGTDWVGLQSMTRELQVPIFDQRHEMYLMTRGFPEPAQMFMTDQF